MSMTTIYKICTATEWREAERAGRYGGSAVDHRDGFIHFSTAEQAAETAARHFAGQHGLVLVSVDADALGSALKWEPSRGGALFPHLYGDLPLAHVRRVRPTAARCRRPACVPDHALVRDPESGNRFFGKITHNTTGSPQRHALRTRVKKINPTVTMYPANIAPWGSCISFFECFLPVPAPDSRKRASDSRIALHGF